MSTKRKRPAADPADTPPQADKPIEVVVRRGALWRFNTLKKNTADLPVTVLWDRRQGERRTASGEPGQERRGTDRRQTPPFTWEVADFVVVAQPATDSGAEPGTAAPVSTSEPKTRRKKKS